MAKLFLLLQRYSFESNSQHIIDAHRPHLGCFSSCKDTHLKAIHNEPGCGLEPHSVVSPLAKILI